MRQACKTVYKFDELTDRAKERARDWWREASAGDSDYADDVIDDAKECLRFAGFTIDRVYFSGFWSQGDGACFEGSWSATDVNAEAMRSHAPQDQELHRIADALQEIAAAHPGASIRVKHRGHYSHEYCTHFSDADFPDDAIDAMDYDSAEWRERNAVLHGIEEELIELARDAMRWIYRQLEREYDYQNSNEAVDDTIRANEYEFTEDGNRYRY